MAIFVKNELKVPDNLSFTYLVASEYSEIQKIRIKILRSARFMINSSRDRLIPIKPAILLIMDPTVEDPIIALPVSMVTEILGSRNMELLSPRTITSTKITGRIASRSRTKGIFPGNFKAFSDSLSLHVSTPNIKTRKNMKKR
ncbi:hypothetical protein MmazTMA_03310 [Methanosarcina mazei]|nr:hypothetical protein MmazTMA_03310 [Methanosarcina mazei]